MLFKDSALLDRIFRVFDADDDNQISFMEYLTCLSIISSKANKDEKIKFSFAIYDFDGDGFISVTDLTAVVAATLREHKILIRRSGMHPLSLSLVCVAVSASQGLLHPSLRSLMDNVCLDGCLCTCCGEQSVLWYRQLSVMDTMCLHERLLPCTAPSKRTPFFLLFLFRHPLTLLLDIDQLVASTMESTRPKYPNMISFEEYRGLVAHKPHMLAQLTINISK